MLPGLLDQIARIYSCQYTHEPDNFASQFSDEEPSGVFTALCQEMLPVPGRVLQRVRPIWLERRLELLQCRKAALDGTGINVPVRRSC